MDLENLFVEEDVERKIEYLNREVKCGKLTFSATVISHHPLWAHYIYNSALELSKYLQNQEHLVRNKKVLELGAGVGVPSMTADYLGAFVTVTDYPDHELLEMLRMNFKSRENCSVRGLLWGDALNDKFDVILMADLVFNHSEQDKLLRTAKKSLAHEGVVLVFFTSHRPWLREKDLEFFKKAVIHGFAVKELFRIEHLNPVFPEDSTRDKSEKDYELRSSVDAYELWIE
eukprot:NODE_593_length_5604_cov_0.739691.p5 type:complete len:230 gc:universal NODE_593_length_5604_cov_0.739691:2527-3216(+)